MQSPAQPTALKFFPRSLRGLMQRGVMLFSRLLLRCFGRVEVVGAPDWAALGPVILAPNHCSFSDPVILQLASKRHLTFLMTQPIYRLWYARWFFVLWRAVPVPDGGAATEALKAALGALESGRSITIFPEGRISPHGKLQSARGGVAWIAERAQVPVIPVALVGTFKFLPKTAHWPRRTTLRVCFGAPLAPPRESEDSVAYAERLMDVIHALGAPRD